VRPGRRVGRAVNAVLSPEVSDEKAGKLALELIREADPPAQTTVELSTNITPEEIERMTLSEAIAYAQANGIPIPDEGAIEGATIPPHPS
jgi:hypothetical protein